MYRRAPAHVVLQRFVHMPDFSNFECDLCGACCQTLIVEAGYVDALREPLLFSLNAKVTRDGLRRGEQCVVLYDLNTRRCPFLRDSYECAIYKTRPNCCVAVEAGDAKCQQARKAVGLPLLRDRDGREPARDVLAMSCRDYELPVEEVM